METDRSCLQYNTRSVCTHRIRIVLLPTCHDRGAKVTAQDTLCQKLIIVTHKSSLYTIQYNEQLATTTCTTTQCFPRVGRGCIGTDC
jgi:hypothetical protein